MLLPLSSILLHDICRIPINIFRNRWNMHGFPVLFESLITDKMWRNSHFQLYSCMICAESKQTFSYGRIYVEITQEYSGQASKHKDHLCIFEHFTTHAIHDSFQNYLHSWMLWDGSFVLFVIYICITAWFLSFVIPLLHPSFSLRPQMPPEAIWKRRVITLWRCILIKNQLGHMCPRL